MIRFYSRVALLLPLLGLAVSNAACHPNDADQYRKAIPNRDTVDVTVPAQSGLAQTVEHSSFPLLGEISQFYRLTRGVSQGINGGVYAVLNLVRDVVHYPPTNISDNTATWGPWTDALSPNTWKVTVTKTSTTEYTYAFQGKSKSAADSAFVTVLSGTHHPKLDTKDQPVEGFGEGNFVLDFDAASTLPEHDANVGIAMIAYSRISLGVQASIVAKLRNVKDDDHPGRRIDIDYMYAHNPDNTGSLEFTYAPVPGTDPNTVTDGPAKLAIKSRWLATGAGRSDVKATGGTVPTGTDATANECWNDVFSSVFLSVSWDPTAGWGDAASCALPDAIYSTLML